MVVVITVKGSSTGAGIFNRGWTGGDWASVSIQHGHTGIHEPIKARAQHEEHELSLVRCD